MARLMQQSLSKSACASLEEFVAPILRGQKSTVIRIVAGLLIAVSMHQARLRLALTGALMKNGTDHQ